MNKTFSKLSILKLTLLSAFLLSLLVLIQLTHNLVNTYEDIKELEADKTLVEVLGQLEHVAHHHAVERGLSAGYIGNGANKQKLEAQRLKADLAIQNLKSILKNAQHPTLNIKHMEIIFNYELQKQDVRAAVNSRKAPNAFKYYSNFNQIVLDIAAQTKNLIFQPKLAKQLTSAFLLAQYKERLGQRRGRVNGVLASGELKSSVRDELYGYSSDLSLLKSYLLLNLQGSQISAYKNINNNTDTKSLENITETIINDHISGRDSLPTNEQWFEKSTQHIGQIKTMLESSWRSVTVAVDKSLASSLYNARLFTVVFLLVFAFVILLNIHLVSRLRSALKHLTTSLTEFEQGKLTADITMQQKDELGEIATATQKTISAFKSLLRKLDGSIKLGKGLNVEMNNATDVVLSDSNQTQAMATNIATAIEEMSQTSREIAESASNTLIASDELHQLSKNLIDNSERSQATLDQLNQSMDSAEQISSEMEKQVQNISSILDTISSIAEQTNLLALNAAIEAARAGEHGRGFAVVADEVRSLASNSKSSSDKIASLLNDLKGLSDNVVASIRKNVELSKATSSEFEEVKSLSSQVYNQSQRLEELATSVSSSAEEQSAVSAEIAHDTHSVQECADHEVQATKQLDRIFKQLQNNSKEIERLLKSYVYE